MQVHGEVASGFETVRKAFEAGADDLGQGGGAFAAYVDGSKVVDLWAGQAGPDRPWERDTRGVIMSSTKGLAALCAHILYDRGRLDIEAPVATYWPGFAANGKAGITVRQCLNHTAGVVGVPGHERELGFDGSGWADYDAIAAWLEQAPPAWEPGTAHGYHAITFGWIVGELIRRIDGRTLGTFFREEVADPLGLTLRIGTPPNEHHLVARVTQSPAEERKAAADTLLENLPPETREAIANMFEATRDETTSPGQAMVARDGTSVLDVLDTFLNSPAALEAEIGSSNGTSTARDLAHVYAVLACGGELDGVRLVSPGSIEVFAQRQTEGPDAVLGMPTTWAVGYMANWGYPGTPKRFGPSDDAFGHAGAGGQIGFCDPERRISVGFVRSHLSMFPVFATSLIETLYGAAG